VPNNKVGIHILFPEEIENAAKLVNNDYKGSWGYVTIPIQSTDRDRVKWQKFLDKCKDLKIIPLIRVATVPEGTSWVEPNDYDLIDFANFLGDLKWPIANRYVIFFNEVMPMIFLKTFPPTSLYFRQDWTTQPPMQKVTFITENT
ncbi:MAG: hypothetical protein UW23_C0038G0006, partial [Candidatus Collierbacteria bacterium GW2011_GWA1_44_12]